MTDTQAEQKAILTRAADVEMRRQAARDAENVEQQRLLEAELRRLWARFAALEREPARGITCPSCGALFTLQARGWETKPPERKPL